MTIDARKKYPPYPIKISCIGDYGQDEDGKKCPGDILSIQNAEDLIEALKKAIEFVREEK